MQENILEIRGLSKQYGSQHALRDVSLSIPQGCITGLLGPNGSGKTTMIKIITGLLSDYEGEVSMGGISPGWQANRHISYLPDKPHVPDWFRVAETLAMFDDFYQDFDKAKATEMLASMDVPLYKRVKALSRGMQEKLQLTLIMARQAKLYVLDEPIAAVDPAARDFIVRTILSNCAAGSSILLSSHLITDIEPALDKAIFLKEGQVYLEDEADAIREKHGMSLDQLFREVFRC